MSDSRRHAAGGASPSVTRDPPESAVAEHRSKKLGAALDYSEFSAPDLSPERCCEADGDRWRSGPCCSVAQPCRWTASAGAIPRLLSAKGRHDGAGTFPVDHVLAALKTLLARSLLCNLSIQPDAKSRPKFHHCLLRWTALDTIPPRLHLHD